jgi:hypothetical protein
VLARVPELREYRFLVVRTLCVKSPHTVRSAGTYRVIETIVGVSARLAIAGFKIGICRLTAEDEGVDCFKRLLARTRARTEDHWRVRPRMRRQLGIVAL